MNKSELIDLVAREAHLSRAESEQAVSAFLGGITGALTGGDKVSLSGFGTFTVTHRAARKGRNPRTGETIDIPASRAAKFKAGKGLKEALGG